MKKKKKKKKKKKIYIYIIIKNNIIGSYILYRKIYNYYLLRLA